MELPDLKQLSKEDLITMVLELQLEVADLKDDLRIERETVDNLDQAAMAYRSAWAGRARLVPQSSRDIPQT